MGSVFQGPKFLVTFQKFVILLSFFSLPHTLFPLRMVPVVVILVNGANHGRGIHHLRRRSNGRTKEANCPIPDGR